MIIRVLIENEAGSRRKSSYDETTLRLLKTEDVSAAYPFAYGFAIGTKAGDGDAADCFVLTGGNLAAGSVVSCEPVGLIEQIEDGEIDHKVLAVPCGETAVLDNAETRIRDFAARVFAHVPGKQMTIGHLLGRDDAVVYLRSCGASE